METTMINVFGILILASLVLGLLFQRKLNSKISKQYLFLLVASSCYILFDILSTLVDGNKSLIALNYIFNVIAFEAIDIIFAFLNGYLITLLKDSRQKANFTFNFIMYAVCTVRMILAIVLTCTGSLFTINENAYYVDGNLAWIAYVVTGASLLSLMISIIQNRKSFTRRQIIVTMTFLLLPLVGLIIQIWVRVYAITAICIVLSNLLLYVLYQDNNIENAKTKEAILEEISLKDLLTDTNNRRAFYEYTSKIGPNEPVGVIFCDINGLKYVNDNFGHAKGDELIQTFANLLVQGTSKENVFRISGDEFVVVMPKLMSEEFLYYYSQVKNLIIENNNIAAIGQSYGNGDAIDQLISSAEKEMYEDKRLTGRARS